MIHPYQANQQTLRMILRYIIHNPRSDHTAFGVVNTTHGSKYHWQLRVIETSDQDMDIGIVKIDKIEVVS